MPAARRFRSPRRLAWAIVIGAAAVLLALALLRPDVPGRVIHPQRHAISGTDRLPLGRYVAAAQAVLGPDDRVGTIAFAEHGPGEIAAAPAPVGAAPPPARATVYLDPPTARVLEVVPDDDAPRQARPLADAALSAEDAVTRADALSRGATLRSVAWPSEHSPDWTVAYRGGGRFKVADDSGRPVAVPARREPGIAAALEELGEGEAAPLGWPVVLLGVALVAVVGAIVARRRPRRQRRRR